jgi:hypothetical protein
MNELARAFAWLIYASGWTCIGVVILVALVCIVGLVICWREVK